MAEDQFQHSCSGAKPGAIRGIALLLFIGVLRDRLESLQVASLPPSFLGTGLLFLAMLFASAPVRDFLRVRTLSSPRPLSAAQLAFPVAFGALTTRSASCPGQNAQGSWRRLESDSAAQSR